MRVTIEIDDIPPSLAREIARLIEPSQETPAEAARPDKASNAWWLGPGRIETLISLLTEGALVALEAIADNAPEARIEDVQTQVRQADPRAEDVNVYGGILSSFGHAKNRMGAPRRIFEVDEYRRVYIIDERVAGAVRNALRRIGEQQG